MKNWRFCDYGCAELETAGGLIVDLFISHWRDETISTEEWTELGLDLVASFAKDGLLVEARWPRVRRTFRSAEGKEVPVRATRKEFASFDMLHSSNPEYASEDIDAYYTKLIERPFEIFLALESEWGRKSSRSATRAEVLEDAIKLSIVRARSKVMIFGPTSGSDSKQLFKDLATLRQSAGDTSPWLLVSNPWGGEKPKFEVLWCGGTEGTCIACAS